MARRLILSSFFGVAACGVSFYLFYMLGFVYLAMTGPLNPPSDPGLQWALRHVALPISVVFGAVVLALFYRRLGRRSAEVIAIR